VKERERESARKCIASIIQKQTVESVFASLDWVGWQKKVPPASAAAVLRAAASRFRSKFRREREQVKSSRIAELG
jgi:hypothetical protein